MINKKTLLLAALFLLVACPMFGQTPGDVGHGTWRSEILRRHVGFGDRGRSLRNWTGEGGCRRCRSNRAQPWRRGRNSVHIYSWFGVYRNANHLRVAIVFLYLK